MNKKKSNVPRVKRMKQASRLESAKHWLPTYTGKSIIKGYRKHYGVNVASAIHELRLLGITLSEHKTIQAATGERQRQLANQARKNKRLEKEQQEEEQLEASRYWESDETYAYIAGNTNWGFPYGITWEEMERIADEESLFKTIPPEYLTINSEDPRDRQ
jgi:hypothetical protein